jgi:hypothetical protein
MDGEKTKEKEDWRIESHRRTASMLGVAQLLFEWPSANAVQPFSVLPHNLLTS